MVLSNKKLKQKLRTALAESLASSVAGTTDPTIADLTNPDPNPLSLKNLLGSATQIPRLSKREKRRKNLSLQGPEPAGPSNQSEKKEANADASTDDGSNAEKKNKKEKKRKRVVEDEELGLEEKKTKKLKKKKKKNKKKKGEGKNKDIENEGGGKEAVTETVQISACQENAEASKRVYVGGIPYYSTEDDIRSYFDSCGTITEVDCMKFPESGKFRGIAIISFKTEAAAKRALALDGSDMGGLFLKIQPYKATRTNKAPDFAPEMVEGYNRIYIGNLSWDITEDELRKFFSGCNVSSIRFGMDKETEEFRGYAHVDFSDNLSLTMALRLDEEIVCGRPVKIRCAVPKKGAKDYTSSAPASNRTESDGGATHSSGKMKRRTCYECGEKGHISSACPKKQAADPKNSSAS